MNGIKLESKAPTQEQFPAVILSTARIVNVQIDAYDLVLRSAALFQLRPLESPSEKFNVCGPGGMYFGQGGMKTLH